MRIRRNSIYLAGMVWLTVSLAAAPCNTAPTVVPESISVELGRSWIVDVLATTSDPDGQALTVSLVSNTCPAQVSAVVDPMQTITVSATDLAPPCQIRYRVDDGAGGTAATRNPLRYMLMSLLSTLQRKFL